MMESMGEFSSAPVRVLRLFDRFCAEQGLTYTVMDALAIAASRGLVKPEDPIWHRPWQAGMPRADFDRAAALAKMGPPKAEAGESAGVDGKEVLCLYKNRAECLLAAMGGETQTIAIYPLDAVSDVYTVFHATVEKAVGGLSGAGKDAFDRYQQLRRNLADGLGETRRLYTIVGKKPEIFRRKDLFPVKRQVLPLADDLEVNVPAGAFAWHENDDQAYLEDLAERCCPLLERIERVCRDHKILYFAVSGLLAGAVCYHDFAPDDEGARYEIGMIRAHYERFVKVMRKKASDYSLQFNEYADEKKNIPLEVRTVSAPDEGDSDAQIRILVFDRIPDDPMTRCGFLEETARKNTFFHRLLKSHTYSGPVNHTVRRNPLTRMAKDRMKEGLRGVGLSGIGRAAGDTVYYMTSSPACEYRKLDRMAQSFRRSAHAGTFARVAFGRGNEIREDMLFPLKKIRFRNLMLPCPGDWSGWLPLPDAKMEWETKCLQEADRILLRELDRVCTCLGIGYFICGGTQLGYVRHGGFIPWDDDVDVGMLRADYDRFLEKAPEILGESFFLQTRRSDPGIPYVYAKIRMENTEYITAYVENRSMHKGVSLDLFPFDYLPDTPGKCTYFVEEVRDLARRHMLLASCNINETDAAGEPVSAKAAHFRRKGERLRQTCSNGGLDATQKAYEQLATRYNVRAKKNGLKIVASFMPTFTWISTDDLLPYRRVDFEGVSVLTANKPEVFLEMQYGDYRKLPPAHKRYAHRLLRWSTWTNKSDEWRPYEE